MIRELYPVQSFEPNFYSDLAVKTFNCDPTIEFLLSEEEIKNEQADRRVKAREDYIKWLKKASKNQQLWLTEPRLFFDW